MIRVAAVLLGLCAAARAEPIRLRIAHEPPPRTLKMRPRTAAAPPPPEAPTTPSVQPADTDPASAKAAAREPAIELGQIRDLRRPISVRFNLGYVVDGTALTGSANLNGKQVQDFEFAQLRAYALGEGYFSSRGVVLQ
jgi:hypothetical protein